MDVIISQLPVSTRTPDATASSTVFIGITQSNGQVTSSAPIEFTSIGTTTVSGGGVITYTQVRISLIQMLRLLTTLRGRSLRILRVN
jgi:hypothetical protein